MRHFRVSLVVKYVRRVRRRKCFRGSSRRLSYSMANNSVDLVTRIASNKPKLIVCDPPLF